MPHRVCSTLARFDLIRVPLPAARTTAKMFGGVIYLGHGLLMAPWIWSHCTAAGWGGRIRTCDPGTKTRCLATWPRPNVVSRRRDYTGGALTYQVPRLRLCAAKGVASGAGLQPWLRAGGSLKPQARSGPESTPGANLSAPALDSRVHKMDEPVVVPRPEDSVPAAQSLAPQDEHDLALRERLGLVGSLIPDPLPYGAFGAALDGR